MRLNLAKDEEKLENVFLELRKKMFEKVKHVLKGNVLHVKIMLGVKMQLNNVFFTNVSIQKIIKGEFLIDFQ